MKYRATRALIVAVCMAVSAAAAYAADDQTVQDVNMAVRTCMSHSLTTQIPPIKQTKVDACSNADAGAAPKCLGLSIEKYNRLLKLCVAQLNNAKCVSAKMKVSLNQYINCGYEKDPIACFRALGYEPEAVVQLNSDCKKGGTS